MRKGELRKYCVCIPYDDMWNNANYSFANH